MIKHWLVIFTLISASFAYSQIPQLEIDDTKSVQDLVKLLERKGDEISNVTFNIPKTLNGDNPVGEYKDGLGFFGLGTGLIMTNGSAKGALGPNDNKNKQQDNNGAGTSSTNDQDLLHFLGVMSDQNTTDKFVGTGTGDIYDYAIIEFDIKTSNPNISFDYIFGSEEYPFPNIFGKSDGFACYVSGPGINGPGINNAKNIATLDDGTVVSIVTINETVNSNFYNTNGNGETPTINFYHQYDGYTNKLTAKTAVTPCETYHVRFLILDHAWAECDSGAFIEASKIEESDIPKLTVEYDNPDYEYLVEGCHEATVSVIVPSSLNFTNYTLELAGTADKLIDYNSGVVPVSLSNFTTDFKLIATLDNLEEGTEEVEIYLKDICFDRYVDTLVLEIKDEIEYELGPLVKCEEKDLELNPAFNPTNDMIVWSDSPSLSCTTCLNPTSNTSDSTGYPFLFTDKVSGCEVEDTVIVTIKEVEAFFIYSVNQDYTTLDAFFENKSKNAEVYFWEFGDGNTSKDFEPEHSYPITNGIEPETFTISLRVTDSLGCEDIYEEKIEIAEPFTIPNVFSPNDDDKNDSFVVQGIFLNRWKLQIFNRWGELVFEDDKYSNDWSANGISDGVYYYQLSNPDKKRVFKGWMTVIR